MQRPHLLPNQNPYAAPYPSAAPATIGHPGCSCCCCCCSCCVVSAASGDSAAVAAAATAVVVTAVAAATNAELGLGYSHTAPQAAATDISSLKTNQPSCCSCCCSSRRGFGLQLSAAACARPAAAGAAGAAGAAAAEAVQGPTCGSRRISLERAQRRQAIWGVLGFRAHG